MAEVGRGLDFVVGELAVLWEGSRVRRLARSRRTTPVSTPPPPPPAAKLKSFRESRC